MHPWVASLLLSLTPALLAELPVQQSTDLACWHSSAELAAEAKAMHLILSQGHFC